jgi:hypothetical protein
MLGVPVLAGAATLRHCRSAHVARHLEDKPQLAKKFYAVVAVAMLLGLSLNYAGIYAVRMLFQRY